MFTQHQVQKQHLKILPQQIQLLNLYFLNNQELEQRIKTELEDNPILEMTTQEPEAAGEDLSSGESVSDAGLEWDDYRDDDIPDYKTEYQNYFSADQLPEIPIVSANYFRDDLKQQLRLQDISENDRMLAEYLVDMLSDRGLMDKPLEDVADDLSFNMQILVDEQELERILSLIQELDPVGIGARDVRECLLLQLERMNRRRPDIRCAYKLVRDHFNDLMHRQFEKVQHSLNIDEDELRIVLQKIGTLNFYPVSERVTLFEPKDTIIPDYIINRDGDDIRVSLLHARSSSVFVNQSLYEQLAGQCGSRDKSAIQYVRNKLQSARWFVQAVKQREHTMLQIMECIVRIQKEYFMDGDIHLLKPMVLRNVADESGLDISTISRITSNKYAETHFGLIYLKDLFSEGIADKKGKVISNKVIQSVIEETISNEDKRHPYTDQQLVHILTGQGYNIARRTVAKYREQMGIPIAQIRSVWV